MKSTAVNWVSDANDGEWLSWLLRRGGSYVARLSGQVLWANLNGGRVTSAAAWKQSAEYMRAWWQEWGWPGTSPVSPGSYGASLVRRLFPEALEGASSYPPWSYRTRFVRDAIYGGRCEVYRPQETLPIDCYDIKASYPSAAMSTLTYGASLQFQRRPSMANLSRPGVSLIVYSDESDLPYLPWRSIGGRVFYPRAHRASGVYTHAEISAALNAGVIVHSIDKQYVGAQAPNPLAPAMAWFLEQREATGDSVWKMAANAVIGRTAANETPLVFWRREEARGSAPRHLSRWLDGWAIGKEVPARMARDVYLAADVLSVARRTLYQAMALAGENLVYVDTDAVHVAAGLSHLPSGVEWGREQWIGRYEGIKAYRKDGAIKLKGAGARTVERLGDVEKSTGRTSAGPMIVVEDNLVLGEANETATSVGVPGRVRSAPAIRARQK